MAKFTKKVRESGSGTLEVTIPKDVVDVIGLQAGDVCEFDIKIKKKEVE